MTDGFAKCCLGLVVLIGLYRPLLGQPTRTKPRPPWTGSKIQGFPDGLSPYRVELAYPQLQFKQLLGVHRIPDSDQLLAIEHDKTWGGPGLITRFADHQQVSKTEVFLRRPEIIYGIAFHPQFQDNGLFFVGCNGKSDALDKVATRVIRFKMQTQPPYACDPKFARVIIEWPSNGHNGGDLAFGKDGLLYVTAGDGTSDSDTQLNGQDLSTIEGSVIRIDVDQPQEDRPYSVPQDNPFINREGARPEIWAYGLRNPWRLTYDRVSDQLWTGNNGQDLWETVHLVRRGENYGWSVMEGSHPFQLNRQRGPEEFVPPTAEHHHSEARSLTGGIVYRGDRLTDLKGAYIYGDYSTGNIWGIRHDGKRVTWHQRIARSRLQITGFATNDAGDLLVTDHVGRLYRMVPQPQTPTRAFPTTLTETGLYTDVTQHQLDPGIVPYSVNSPLWSDGAFKERFLALPGDRRAKFKANGSWDLPEGTVLVKTFSLSLDGTDRPRRVETRLLARQGKEWYGYSYRWNPEQTEAVLVAEEGADAEFEVVDAKGNHRKQVWRFPSRSECMVCHTRAANFVLGLTTPQLNRDLPDAPENQLERFERLDVIEGDRLPKRPGELGRLVDPYDKTAKVSQRARSYLQANCAACHVNAGGGNSRIVLSHKTPSDKMQAIDTAPQHDHFGITQPQVIAAGRPADSVLLKRMRLRGRGQMPPLATSVVDEAAARLIEAWIVELGR